MSTTAERLFYPLKKTFGADPGEWRVSRDAGIIAEELAAENLVLASREDIRLAFEIAYRDQYGDLETPLDDTHRVEFDGMASRIFSELERSA